MRRRLVTAALRLVLLLVLAAGCSVGSGTGFVRGRVQDGACRLDLPDFSLQPSFFGGDFIEDPTDSDGETRKRLTIRLQRGSYWESASDGVMITIDDVNEIERSMIGVPIPIGAGSDALVQLTLYLNQTCRSGNDEETQIPSIMEAYGGTITFTEIYAPDVDGSSTQTTATFQDVVLDDPRRDDRSGLLSGEFSFSYQRGRPAQPFP